MEEDETLKVLDKGYTTTNHVKKIIRTLPKKWRLMVTSLKVPKDLNKTTLEDLVSSLRSNEIKLEEDEVQRQKIYMAIKSKTKALQAKEEKCEEESDDEDELSLLSRRVNHLLKKDRPTSEAIEKEEDLSQTLDRISLE